MAIENLSRPEASEHPPGFGRYIPLTPAGDIVQFLEKQGTEVVQLLAGLTDAEALMKHAPYTWSIKQVVGHVTDAERIFAYRCLRIARNDATPLPSFDENAYMQSAAFDRYALAGLVSEFELVRRSHVLLFQHMESAAWLREGMVSGHRTTARALPYVMTGHAQHHLNILRQRLGR